MVLVQYCIIHVILVLHIYIYTWSYLPFLAIINGSPNEEEWGEKDLKLCITSVYKYF